MPIAYIIFVGILYKICYLIYRSRWKLLCFEIFIAFSFCFMHWSEFIWVVIQFPLFSLRRSRFLLSCQPTATDGGSGRRWGGRRRRGQRWYNRIEGAEEKNLEGVQWWSSARFARAVLTIDAESLCLWPLLRGSGKEVHETERWSKWDGMSTGKLWKVNGKRKDITS